MSEQWLPEPQPKTLLRVLLSELLARPCSTALLVLQLELLLPGPCSTAQRAVLLLHLSPAWAPPWQDQLRHRQAQGLPLPGPRETAQAPP